MVFGFMAIICWASNFMANFSVATNFRTSIRIESVLWCKAIVCQARCVARRCMQLFVWRAIFQHLIKTQANLLNKTQRFIGITKIYFWQITITFIIFITFAVLNLLLSYFLIFFTSRRVQTCQLFIVHIYFKCLKRIT